MFHWINTLSSANLRTRLSGAYHRFGFGKYAKRRYLGAIVYRYIHRFNLRVLPNRLLVAAATAGPRAQHTLDSLNRNI
jgi:hypothetical protein